MTIASADRPILFATAHWPHPLAAFRHGTALRMRMLMRAASRLGPPLDLLVYRPASGEAPAPGLQAWRDGFQHLWQVPLRHIHVLPQEERPDMEAGLWRSYLRPALSAQRQPNLAITAGARQARGLRDVLQATAPALLINHRLAAMLPALAQTGALPPMVFDLDDIEHKAFKRALALPPHWKAKQLMHLWVPTLRRIEQRAVHAAAATLVCSAADADELRRLHGCPRVQVLPNALVVPQPSPLPAEPTLLFLGLYQYPPNRQAAEHLIDDIWPLVRQRHPQARLFMAGSHPHAVRQSKAPPPGVEFLGFVDDLDALYARSRVVACPVRSGGGTRVKIIEAALQARPVVSTTLGAEGLDLSAQRGEITITDDASAFAAAVCGLFDDTAAAQRQANAARQRALAVYDEEQVTAWLVQQLRSLLPA